MCKREDKYIEITDLKDMLLKTNQLYQDKTAYKIKIEKEKYITYTHAQVREMINALRNSAYSFRIKRKKNCYYWGK